MKADPGFLLLASYGYGGGMQVNAALDSSTPSIHPIRVLGKRMTRSRGTSYYLQLEPWESLPQKEISVPRSAYQAIEAGDTVCATPALGRAARGVVHGEPVQMRRCRPFLAGCVVLVYFRLAAGCYEDHFCFFLSFVFSFSSSFSCLFSWPLPIAVLLDRDGCGSPGSRHSAAIQVETI